MSVYVIDTETSQQEKPEVIELAWVKVEMAPNGLVTECEHHEQRFKPDGPISCGARAVHHILDYELEACHKSSFAVLPPDADYIIGHNVDFDAELFLPQRSQRRICTLALARHFWPEKEGHSLGACMYRISKAPSITREKLRSAHSALVDVRLCMELLDHFLSVHLHTITTFEQLWQASETARIPKVWAFGKHKGKPIYEADKGYLTWCLRQPDMDQYVKEACRRVLAGEY